REYGFLKHSLISGAGRSLSAHHAMLRVNVFDVGTQKHEVPEPIDEGAHSGLHELAATYTEFDERSVREVYHDTSYAKEQVMQHFNSGTMSLRERALAERYHLAIMNRVADVVRKD